MGVETIDNLMAFRSELCSPPMKLSYTPRDFIAKETLRKSAIVTLICLKITIWPGYEQVANAQETEPRNRPNLLFVLADDWSYPHAGVYGDPLVKTPNFDRVARQGVLFSNAFCVAPTCTPSRASLLTGQTIHRLEDGANLFGILPKKFPIYTDLLEAAGYYIGYEQKGWGPGYLKDRPRNPAGPRFKNFEEFLSSLPKDKPFHYWLGSTKPHRKYWYGSGWVAGLKLEEVLVPRFLPDKHEVRMDLLDYYQAVQEFDAQLGAALKLLEETGKIDNTLVVVTSDNGMPFPHGKANLYDAGTHMPMAVQWLAKTRGGKVVNDFVSFTDLAPTFLEAARVEPAAGMDGRSFLPVVTTQQTNHRDHVFLERERHANMRQGNLTYPARAVRTKDFLYIRNLRPDRWPAGDPEVSKGIALDAPYGDVDEGPTRTLMVLLHKYGSDSALRRLFELAFGKRPPEELYDLSRDPDQINNVAVQREYEATKKQLIAELERWMRDTADPRALGGGDEFDRYPYYGPSLGVRKTVGSGSPDR